MTWMVFRHALMRFERQVKSIAVHVSEFLFPKAHGEIQGLLVEPISQAPRQYFFQYFLKTTSKVLATQSRPGSVTIKKSTSLSERMQCFESEPDTNTPRT